ncbi:MAG: hypothetical protein K8I82_16980, partial [Anaerolineae bacterium]|nr:hypothetical protein [Anaerolineae bacterium]
GMFVLVKGKVKILDYKYIAATLERLPKMAKSVNKIVQSAPDQSNANLNQLADLNKLPIKEISQFIEQNMEDALRIKIYPYGALQGQVFIATADATNFRYNTVSLINMYGHMIDANWSCLLQINIGHETPMLSMAPLQPTDSFEGILELFVDQLTVLNKALQGTKFPAVSATPIAIFRDI